MTRDQLRQLGAGIRHAGPVLWWLGIGLMAEAAEEHAASLKVTAAARAAPHEKRLHEATGMG